MKFTIVWKNVIPEEQPEVVGEFLRNEFFNQDGGKLGCYDTFEMRDNVEFLEDRQITDEEGYFEHVVHVYQKKINGQNIKMEYFWDGDGDLEFVFEDGSYLENDDCKKTYNWEYYANDL